MQDSASPGVAEGGEVVVFPLSFAQLRLWLLDRMDPGSAAYNIPGAFRRRGPLDPRVVARALSEIVARHESLRTRFGVLDGEPVQLVSPPGPVRLPVHDLSGLPVPARDAEVRKLAVAEGRTPFDLERGPLLRARLVRLAPDVHLLFVTLHHIVSDGWSTSVFRRELSVLARAFAAGEPSPLPELPIQYGDYAVWQREELAGEALEAQVAFWRAELEGAPPALELPLDRPRPPVRRGRGARLVVDVAPDTCRSLAALARTEGATPFMVLLAASGVLLGRYGATEDLVIGTPITGRTQEELEGLIGFFVNTLAIRVDLGGDPHFPDLLGRVRTRLLAAYAHPDLPFDRVVDELRVPRDPGRTPVFQVMFVLQAAEEEVGAGESAEGAEPDWTPVPVRTGTAKVDLALSFVERSGQLAVTLDYDADLFDRSTIGRFGRHLRTLLDGIAAEPRRRLSGVPMLSPREEEQLLLEWNGERAEVPWVPVHRQFVERAGCAPETPAAVIGDEVIPYGELEARSARLARRLRAEGVGPECRVALLAGRSPELLAGMLGILRAGGAYVPLDPSAPGERVAHVLRDSGARVLLVQEHLRDLVSGFDGRVLSLADEPAAGPPLPEPDPEVAPDALAYVIYTSGSTGTPKGVMVPHGALENLVRAEVDLHGFGPSTRLFSALPVSFDASVGDVFPVLACGGALVWHPAAAELSAGEMLRYVRRHGVDSAGLPVALWSYWLDGLEAEPGDVGSGLPATTRVGGESLPLERARAWLRLAGGHARLFNHYGPTETTVAATAHLADDVGARTTVSGSVPIGRPLPNTAAYVVDSHLRPVPVGVAGELYVGGAQVARGYQGRPDLTAERFLPDPFRGSPGARMYRTGDRARRLPDGVLEFLGRTDTQVKIRGFRVEPGEVEAALRAHPGVRDAAVVAGKGPDGASRLVGYVARDGGGADTSALRAHLRGRLPDYMVPSVLVVLPSLPLTSHGKVDRRALPEPPEERRGEFRAPRTPLEEALAAVWGEVLGVDRVGIHDDFFDLGGHSLAASKVVARIRERLGHEVSLAELFRSATVERLALRLDGGSAAELPPSIVRLRDGAGTPFFCVHAAGGMALAYLRLARRLDDRPVYGLQARGLAPGEAPIRSVEEMAARYVEAVRAVQPRGPYLLGGWSVGGVVAFEMARRLEADGEEVALLALIDSWAPLDGSRPTPPDDADLLVLMAADLAVRADPGALSALREELRALPDDARLPRFEGWLRRVEPGLRDADSEGLRRRLAVYRATGDAAFAYRAEPYGGRATLFRAARSAVWASGDLSPAAWERDPRLRWRELTSGPLDVHGVAGNHHSIVVGQDVDGLAAALRSALATASPAESRPDRS